jgi:coatomer subunit beta'
LVAITAEDSFYILRFDREAYEAKLEEGGEIGDEGIEEAFDLVSEVSESYVFRSYSVDVELK